MKKVLIIEDEKMLSRMYKDKFEFENFEVLTASDGEEGVNKALGEKPDILIVDILLPKKEGVEVLKEVRESGDWGEKVPIILLTNLDSSNYILDAIGKYSPSYYFVKANIELSEVVEKMKELVADN